MRPPEDPLDALLQERDVYIEDAGFTSRVMKSLPARRRLWLRPAILLGASLIGFGLMVWWLPPLGSVFSTGANGGLIVNLNMQLLFTLGALTVAAGSLLWSVFAVVKSED